jgi:HEAT repeat protein
VPVIEALMRDPDERVRAFAALAITGVTDQPMDVSPTFLGLLDDADPNGRGTAAYSLGQIGPAARPAVPKLKELLADTAITRVGNRLTVGQVAGNSLRRLDPAATETAERP